jgi:CRISPR/Cas system-associated endonuclease Cas3-HD
VKCQERNASRDRVVPKEVINKMYKSFDIPWYNEGWDSINIAYTDPSDKGSLGNWRNFIFDTISYDQDNEHHKETLGAHCFGTFQYVSNVSAHAGLSTDARVSLNVAAAIHDCGKPFTKTYKNAKGEDSEQAHYYNHEHVGCYESLFFEFDDFVDPLLVSALIRWHMVLHFFKDWNQKTVEKYEHEFTTGKYLEDIEFYKCLKFLHEGDKKAH